MEEIPPLFSPPNWLCLMTKTTEPLLSAIHFLSHHRITVPPSHPHQLPSLPASASGSGNIPSISNLRLASSRAQVWILLPALAPLFLSNEFQIQSAKTPQSQEIQKGKKTKQNKKLTRYQVYKHIPQRQKQVNPRTPIPTSPPSLPFRISGPGERWRASRRAGRSANARRRSAGVGSWWWGGRAGGGARRREGRWQ